MIWAMAVSPASPLASLTCFLATMTSVDFFKCVIPSHASGVSTCYSFLGFYWLLLCPTSFSFSSTYFWQHCLIVTFSWKPPLINFTLRLSHFIFCKFPSDQNISSKVGIIKYIFTLWNKHVCHWTVSSMRSQTLSLLFITMPLEPAPWSLHYKPLHAVVEWITV